MPDAFEIALTEKITRMCVAKEGATTYYVDGTSGNDGANGLTWESAKKTIQAAVNIADSWANIYIKDGTYTEQVFIVAAQPGISLIGESRENTIVSDAVLYRSCINIAATNVEVCNIHVAGAAYAIGIGTSGDRAHIHGCYLDSQLRAYGNYHVIEDCVLSYAVLFGAHTLVQRNWCLPDTGVSFYETTAEYNIVRENSFVTPTFGVKMKDYGAGQSCRNTVTHNNFDVSPHPVVIDDGVDNTFFENYYGGHSNIDNGSGIATPPYAIAGAAGNSDPRPVIVRNGWLAHALSGVNGNAVADLTGRTISGDTGLIAHGSETECSAIIGQSGKRAILQGGVVRGIQDGLAAGKKLTLRVYKYNGTGWDKVDDYDVTKDSGLEANIGHAAHDDYMKIAVLHDDATGTKTFYYKFIIQDMEE